MSAGSAQQRQQPCKAPGWDGALHGCCLFVGGRRRRIVRAESRYPPPEVCRARGARILAVSRSSFPSEEDGREDARYLTWTPVVLRSGHSV